MIIETSTLASKPKPAPAASDPVSLGAIEAAARAYDAACAELEDSIALLESDLAAVKEKHLRGLKKLASKVAGLEADGLALVESAPHLFVKPRTITMHGIKTGFTVREGRLVCKDEDRAIELLRSSGRFTTEQIATCIRTKEELDKDKVKELPAASLKTLGCSIEGAGDAALFRRTPGDVEKLINKLITKLVEAMAGES